ncbi:MAG: prephenate dehydratase domain-containing protein [Oscillospiraceae bacterium]|nr:prephenate dehydratase domain-containing protein [Oscillospiraceae bacterium]
MFRKKLIKYMPVFISAMILLSGCEAGKTVSDENSEINITQNAIISYLGPEGTYTEEAAKLFFGEESDTRPQKTVADAVDMLLDGNCDYAVIPQENTIGGPVYDYIDEFLSHRELSVAGEVELPIRQALMAKDGVRLDNIKTVYSHKQGIVQGADWLKNNLPNAEIIEVSSTAEGAKMVSESDSGNSAAIASVGAARVYGLSVLAENIQMNEDNKTRFYILSTDEPQENASGRMVFTACGEASGLSELLSKTEKPGIKPLYIHDRPEKTVMGRYIWLIECEGGGFEDYKKIADATELELQYRGAFPVK